MWGALLARALTATGIVVVIPDMRNYPLVSIPYMVEDIDLAIDWTIKNVADFGGDPRNVVVVGQSAGGHVALMAILKKIQEKTVEENGIAAARGSTGGKGNEELNMLLTDEKWMPSDLKGFVAISSPLNLNLREMTESFQRQGFDNDIIDRMFGFERDKYDPFLALKEFQNVERKSTFLHELPPFKIYHGTDDKTVPYKVSDTFFQELQKTLTDEKSVSFDSYSGWSHTDPILEGPMDADHRLHKDLFNDVQRWTQSPSLTWPDDPVMNSRLCPHFLVEASRYMNPF